MMTSDELIDREFDAFIPLLRSDLVTRFIENEAVSWSPLRSAPTLLDPVASVIYQLIDGSASIGDLITDVNEVLGVPQTIARDRLRQVVRQFDSAGLLHSAPSAVPHQDSGGIFPGPLNT